MLIWHVKTANTGHPICMRTNAIANTIQPRMHISIQCIELGVSARIFNARTKLKKNSRKIGNVLCRNNACFACYLNRCIYSRAILCTFMTMMFTWTYSFYARFFRYLPPPLSFSLFCCYQFIGSYRLWLSYFAFANVLFALLLMVGYSSCVVYTT